MADFFGYAVYGTHQAELLARLQQIEREEHMAMHQSLDKTMALANSILAQLRKDGNRLTPDEDRNSGPFERGKADIGYSHTAWLDPDEGLVEMVLDVWPRRDDGSQFELASTRYTLTVKAEPGPTPEDK